ncbi:hypothetical protein [Candidatus Magnetominusculus xianensis]|uniref:Uncharacterized protein n=1 Tax=Candidatus Magnetominusculus xianensis TaxID=1748249 RepID=A0ABR5SD85_9BACT|nr:hypothetical protein [Candidatus Magnetominusculus xianensis]KWT78410.1 hypothetical protein ASN18_2818 [Candidatus Magnetominusculus xianensis]MBF0403163.1 hypothetical protein [Nitrospirota bacterium]
MSTKFWVQDEDGKLDGSLPGVPKKGYVAEVSEKEDGFVDFKVKQFPDADEQEKKRRKTDKIIAAILDILRKGLKQHRSIDIFKILKFKSIFTLEEVTAMFEMYAQYRKMGIAMDKARKLGIDPRELDKFYHCRAHCIGSRVGLGGIAASHKSEYAKELWDLFLNATGYGTIKGNFEERIVASIIDTIGDLAANSQGRIGDPRKSCNEICNDLWPDSIPLKIRDEADQEFGK